jgi:hypothetical protein
MTQHFHIITSNPNKGDEAGRIEEGWYVDKGGKVILTDHNGIPIGEEREIERDALFTAKRMLRDKLQRRSARSDFNRRIVYKDLGIA